MSGASSCGTNHNYHWLSFTSMAISAFLFVSTSTMNFLILYIMVTRRDRRAFQSIFFKILFNITLCDFITGLVVDCMSVTFHMKEGLTLHISVLETKAMHSTMFLMNGAAILTMSVLCVDRLVALLKPFKYRHGLSSRKLVAILVLTWIVSALLTSMYFQLGYIKNLAIFAFTTVTGTFACLVVTAIIFRKKFTANKFPHVSVKDEKLSEVKERREENDDSNKQQENLQQGYATVVTLQVAKYGQKMSAKEKRVNTSFVIMLVVFLMTYLPSCCMIVYMNSCTECNCKLVHVLRDATWLAVLSSSLLRAINFLYRLTPLKRAALSIFWCKEQAETESSQVMGSSQFSVKPNRSGDKISALPGKSKE